MASPPSLAHHFVTEAYQNAWANHRLLGACAQLSQAEFAAKRTSFFPSIQATANHILTVDWFYLEALERSRRGASSPRRPGEVLPAGGPVRSLLPSSRASSSRRTAGSSRTANPWKTAGSTRPSRSRAATASSATASQRILAHLFQHDIHHRGQVHAMLAGTGVKPPQLDEFYCAAEAHLRAADFAALGFTEAAIWRGSGTDPDIQEIGD